MAPSINKCLCGDDPQVAKTARLYRVVCNACGRHGTAAYRREIAIEVWNEYIEFLSHRRATNTI